MRHVSAASGELLGFAAGGHSEELFKLLIDGIKDYAIFLLDTDGFVRSWNLGAEHIKGYTRDEIVGRHFSVFYPDEAIDRNWPERELEIARRDGRCEDEGWRVRKDGSRFWANVVITALYDQKGVLLGYSKVTRDLSERKLHEDLLRESEDRFRLLVEGVKEYAIFMLNPDGTIATWNRGAQRVKQYRAEEAIGRHFSIFFSEEDVRRGKPEWELQQALRNGSVEDEGWRMRKDGSVFWADVTLTALYAPDGHLAGFAKITRDMSDRKRLDELEKSSRRMNEFLAMLAHELRNPLAPMRNAVTIMQLEAVENLVVLRCRDMIDRQLRHLSRLVDDLLDVGRISTGKIVLQKEPVPLSLILTRSLELARPGIDLRGHRLELSQAPGEIWLNGDPTRLAQVFHNLLNNAAKFTPNGGLIRVRTRQEARTAVIEIADNGIGIRAERLQDIFNLFTQEEDRINPSDSGLGIGLTIVRLLVEMHGGSVEADSAGIDQGSTFTVRLPLETPPAGAAPAPAGEEDRAAGEGRRASVLIVDDNHDAADSLAMLVEMLGYAARVAYGGADALAKARESAPDLVLLDIGMPGLSGYEVARELRAMPQGAAFRIVAMTGFGQSADRERALASGFDAHLTKPVDGDTLRRLLLDTLGDAR